MLTESHRFNFTNRLSLSYDITSRHTLGISWRTQVYRPNADNFDETQHTLQLHSKSRYYSNNLALNYSGRLNDNGDRLTFSAEWMDYQMKQDQQFYNSPPYAGISTKERSSILQASFDYAHPFSQSHTLNAGATYQLIKIKSDEEKAFISLPPTPIHTDVITQTPLVYASMTGAFGALRYYGALNWQMNATKVNTQKTRTQNAINPTLQLSLPFGAAKDHSLTALYKHILLHIPYDALSDVTTWADAYNYNVGNPELKAPTEHYVNINAGFWNKRLNLSATYFHTANEIAWQTFTDPGNPDIHYTAPVNTGAYNNYSFLAEYTQRLFNVWRIKGSAYLALNTENMLMGDTYYNGVRFRQYYSLNTAVVFKSWGAGLVGFVEPTFRRYDRTYHTVSQIECTVYKTFLNNNLQLIAKLVPFDKRRKITRQTSTETITYKYTTPSQRCTLSIVWFFSGGKKDIDIDVKGTTLDYQQTKDKF